MGKHKDSGEKRHDKLVNMLELILFNEFDYEEMWKFFDYCRNGQVGEVDLLAYADGKYDFYEVKCSSNPKSRKKAYEQFEKYKLAYNRQIVDGYLFTGDLKIKRL